MFFHGWESLGRTAVAGIVVYAALIVVLAEGIAALALLVAFRFAVTWLSVRSATVRRLARGEPTLRLYQGDFREEAMRCLPASFPTTNGMP